MFMNYLNLMNIKNKAGNFTPAENRLFAEAAYKQWNNPAILIRNHVDKIRFGSDYSFRVMQKKLLEQK